MLKAILKDVLLVFIVIVAQLAMNKIGAKESNMYFIVASGILVGAIDFIVSFCKIKLESVNYTIKGITKTKNTKKK